MERVKLSATKAREELLPILLAKQGGKCPICQIDLRRIEERNVCIDHCHITGVIRGALCRNCNGLEGRISAIAKRGKKDLTVLKWLRNVVEYLTLHQTPQTQFIHHSFKTPEQKLEARNAKARQRYALKKQGKLNG